jgi:hypothetical protein
VEGWLRGQLLASREAFQDYRARSADLFVTHHSGAAMRESMRDETYKLRGRPRLCRRSLPCFAGSKERDVLTPSVAHPATRHSVAREGSGRPRGRVPHVCPRNITIMIRMHTMHVGRPQRAQRPAPAQPSQREGQLDEDADYQTAYQSARTGAVNEDAGDHSSASGPLHDTG